MIVRINKVSLGILFGIFFSVVDFVLLGFLNCIDLVVLIFWMVLLVVVFLVLIFIMKCFFVDDLRRGIDLF